MKLRELIKDKTILDNASVFVSALRNYDGSLPNISIGIYQSGEADRSLYQLSLTREVVGNLIRELSAALAVEPYSQQEIEHHKQVVADRIYEGRYL